MRWCVGNDIYTSDDSVRLAVMFADGRLGDVVIDLAPGETKNGDALGK